MMDYLPKTEFVISSSGPLTGNADRVFNEIAQVAANPVNGCTLRLHASIHILKFPPQIAAIESSVLSR